MTSILAAGIFPTAAESAKQRPNVLFIIADDLNCYLGAYDDPVAVTPNLDRLAASSLRFNGAYCNLPLCGPSRASFMTGLYPEQNGVVPLRALFRDTVPNARTMSQHFMQQGYRSVRVGKIYHYDNPNAIGTNGHDDPLSWDERYNPIGRDKEEENKIFSLTPGQFGGTLSWLAADGRDEEQTDGLVATQAIDLLQRFATTPEPFFLAIGFYKPHTPFVAPLRYFDLYDPEAFDLPSLRVPDDYLSSLPDAHRKWLRRMKAQNDLSEKLTRQATHAYYATISFMDAQVGRVLDSLDELGLRENTVVVFTSDHGYHMGEHDYFQKSTLFDNSLRVPLMIYAPGMTRKGETTEEFFEFIDLYRTLSGLAGLPEPPPYVQGFDQSPLLNDPNRSFRDHSFGQLNDPNRSFRDNSFDQLNTGYSIRTKHYRFTRWETDDADRYELYDLTVDPGELNNLATSPRFDALRTKLEPLLEERIEEARAPIAVE